MIEIDDVQILSLKEDEEKQSWSKIPREKIFNSSHEENQLIQLHLLINLLLFLMELLLHQKLDLFLQCYCWRFCWLQLLDADFYYSSSGIHLIFGVVVVFLWAFLKALFCKNVYLKRLWQPNMTINEIKVNLVAVHYRINIKRYGKKVLFTTSFWIFFD